MTKLSVILAVIVSTCGLVGAFANCASKAPVPYANAIPVKEQQQVMEPNSEEPESFRDLEAVPQDPQILSSADNGMALMPTDLNKQDALSGIGSLKTALDLAKAKAEELDLKEVASDIEAWVKAHPWKAAFYTASALSFFAPEIISIPALEALGFGVAGVRAGSIAAKVQSVIGPVAARSVFAIWQSARMGGYGVSNVNGGVRALVALADAAVIKCNPLKDCKGLMSNSGKRLRGDTKAKLTLATVCVCLVGLSQL